MKVKHLIAAVALMCIVAPTSFARKKDKKVEKPEGYVFENVIEIPHTPIKNQASTGTCWAFSSISFFESEALVAGYKGDLDLAEMFIVHNAYQDRLVKYVRMHGILNFAAGSSFGNTLEVLKKYGIVPESQMNGLNYGSKTHRHGELDALAKAYAETIRKNPNGTFTTAWKRGFRALLDEYLGECPKNFVENGKQYTPKTYMESLGLNLDDYVSVTSYTHNPFYKPMVVEVPDNWIWEQSYNVPVDEMIEIIDNSLKNGHSVAWAADVSESGFSGGLALVPDYAKLQEEIQAEEIGSDQARWTGEKTKVTPKKKAFMAPCPELEITQEMRQEGYDTFKTTDDHGMHIVGMAKDQIGKKYYIVKNSWGAGGKYKGYWYVSEAYVKYKTMDILINKNIIPDHIKAKINANIKPL